MALFDKSNSLELTSEVLLRTIDRPVQMFAQTISKRTGNSIYQDIILLFRKGIKDHNGLINYEINLGTFFEKTGPYKEEMNNIWEQLWDIYEGDSNIDNTLDFLYKVLGLLLAIEFCKDSNIWQYTLPAEYPLYKTADKMIYKLKE